jgi:hypothetical protein
LEEVRASNIALTEQRKRFEAIESEQVKTIAAERDSLNAKLTAIQVDQGVLTVATKKGLRSGATDKPAQAPKNILLISNDLGKFAKIFFSSRRPFSS